MNNAYPKGTFSRVVHPARGATSMHGAEFSSFLPQTYYPKGKTTACIYGYIAVVFALSDKIPQSYNFYLYVNLYKNTPVSRVCKI